MIRSVAPLVSLGLAVLTVALILVGLPLTVAPGSTDRLFSWTIDVPLTATFLGACYWAAALFAWLALRERVWARVRPVIPGILVAGTLISAATLIHLDKFAMDTVRGWIWLILYACLPPGVVVLLVAQRRQTGTDPQVGRPIERWATPVLVLGAAALLVLGAALYAFPADTAGWWPWPLTALTARMAGAWVAAIGATLAAVAVERDWTRVNAAMIYLLAVAAAFLAALAAHPGTVEWDTAAAWLYVASCVGLLALAAYGIRAQRMPGPAPGYSCASTLSTTPSGSRTKKRRTPHGSSTGP